MFKNILIAVAVVVALFFIFSVTNNSSEVGVEDDITKVSDEVLGEIEGESEVSGIVYYYGQECPHCQNVEKFLDENNIAAKVSYSKKEVWHNAKNKAELDQVARACGLDPAEIGVPFLYANGRCIIGEPKVKQFFTEEAGL